MQVEFHQLDRRLEHLLVRSPQRRLRLLASLAESGPQTPVVVVAAADQPNRYLVIDGYERIAALEQLKRDTVEAVVWPMGEAEALVLGALPALVPTRDGARARLVALGARAAVWLRPGRAGATVRSQRELVSRRLALVELLPQAIQQQVREGKVTAHLAIMYLVPVARANVDDCERMAAAFAKHRWSTRHAGKLYAAWRDGSSAIRQRLLEQPELFLKAQRQAEPQASNGPAGEQLRDFEIVSAIVNRASRRLADAREAPTPVAPSHRVPLGCSILHRPQPRNAGLLRPWTDRMLTCQTRTIPFPKSS